MDYEKLERLARIMEPFEKANEMMESIPAAVRLADAAARVNLPIANMNRIQELAARVSSVSSSLNIRAFKVTIFRFSDNYLRLINRRRQLRRI